MINLILKRFRTGQDGTFGELQTTDGRHLFFTVECSWLDNKAFESCVPPGWYDTEWVNSPSHGYCLELENVLDNRKYCQFHSANWAYQLQGCIALGISITLIKSIKKGKKIMGVSSSRTAIKDFNEHYGNKEIRLKIHNLF